ncbi:MAG: hypothetical protein ACM3N5_00175 [Candidatus Eiseniibacteriota bacterium]
MSSLRKSALSGAGMIVLTAAVLSLGACERPPIGKGEFGRTVSMSRGDVLVSANGDALYTFDKDTPDHSNCTDACAATWPPAVADADAQPHGKFSIITRPGGARQWAYQGKPLYTYKLDGGPGSISGDNYNGVWHVAKP